MSPQDFDLRVWNITAGKYLPKRNSMGFSLCLRIKDDEISPFYPMRSRTEDREIDYDEFEIELYTGFNDSEGNKIFKGDILESYVRDDPYFEIKHYEVINGYNGEWRLMNLKDKKDCETISDHLEDRCGAEFADYRVIGNIHERSEKC